MMRLTLVMVFFLGFMIFPAETAAGQSSDGSEVEELLERAEEKREAGDEEAGLDLFMRILEIEPDHFEALWNASLLHATVGFRFEDESDQEEYYNKAVELASRAIEADGDDGHGYYVMSVAKGRMTDVVGSRQRVELSHVIEENVKKSLERMPEHAPSLHLYGVWHSEVANVSRAERMAARFISRGIPDGSDEQAEEYLHKAVELDPDTMIIRMDLARHYLRSGQDDKAIPHLQKVLEMEPESPDDPDMLEEARELLNDLN